MSKALASEPNLTLNLPKPGQLLQPTKEFALPNLRAIKIDPKDPFKITFIVEGNNRFSGQNPSKEELEHLTKFFLAFLTLPEKDLWVNLSPYEKDRIIPSDFELTDAGKEMLSQDYILKQLSSSLTFPESELGKIFWQKVAKNPALSKHVSVSNFNKVWVVPQRAILKENNNRAFIQESHLKVMVEADYQAINKNNATRNNSVIDQQSQIIKETIVPAIEREVNEGKHFASLRQMYHALVLAIWFKQKLKQHIINEIYSNQKKTNGITIDEKEIKERIYTQYLNLVKKGAYNIIKEHADPITGKTNAQQYFAGGFSFANAKDTIIAKPIDSVMTVKDRIFEYGVRLIPIGITQKLLLSLIAAASIQANSNAQLPVTAIERQTISNTQEIQNIKSQLSTIIANDATLRAKYPQFILQHLPSNTSSTNLMTITGTVAPSSKEDTIESKNSGIVENFDSSIKNYKKGDRILTLIDPQLQLRITTLKSKLKFAEKRFTELKALYQQQAASLKELLSTQLQISDLTEQLAEATREQSLGDIMAPTNFTLTKSTVANEMKVAKGQSLLTYNDSNQSTISFTAPAQAALFNRIASFTINGKPVDSISSLTWTPDYNGKGGLVDISVRHSLSLPPTDSTISISLVKGEQNILNSIKGVTSTLSTAANNEPFTIRTPFDGHVQVSIKEGEFVKKGQVIAEIEHELFNEEYRQTYLTLKSIEALLQKANDPNGNLIIKREELDNLKSDKEALTTKLTTYQKRVERTFIQAPIDGTILSIKALNSNQLSAQDPVVQIQSKDVVLGGSTSQPILFPKNLSLTENQPVVIQLAGNTRIAGRINHIDLQPKGPNASWNDYQSIEVIANDPSNQIQPGMPLTIIIPNTIEQITVNQFLNNNATSLPSINLTSEENLLTTSTTPTTTVTKPLFANTLTNSPTISLKEIPSLVAGNELVIGTSMIEMLERRESEAFPKAKSFGLNGGVWMTPDGQLKFGGGVMASINNSIAAGVSSGNAIGAALPLVFQLSGNIIDVITGKVNKQTALAVKMTEIAFHQMENDIANQILTTEQVLIDIGHIEYKMNELQGNIDYLNLLQKRMKEREKSGFSLLSQRLELIKNINTLKQQLIESNQIKSSLVRKLNLLAGKKIKDFNDAVYPDLPWVTSYAPITSSQLNAWETELLSSSSNNPRIKGAKAASKAMDMSIRLQGLNELPTVNMAGVLINNGKDLHPLYTFSQSDSILRTSAVNEGLNAVAHGQINLYDSARNTKERILALEKEKATLNEQQIATEVARELHDTVAAINSLSERINIAASTYQNAKTIWEAKKNSVDASNPEQEVKELNDMMQTRLALLDLKSQYLKVQFVLKKLGVTIDATGKSGEPLDNIRVNILPTTLPTFLTQQLPTVLKITTTKNTIATTIRPGQITYQASDITGAFAILDQGVNSLKDILIHDVNIFNRHAAAQHLFNEYQHETTLETLTDILLKTPYDDVRWEILTFQLQQGNSLVNLITIANEAATHNNSILFTQTINFIEQYLQINHQKALNLTAIDFKAIKKDITSAGVNSLLLTIFNNQPVNSAITETLLRSSIWTDEDLADVFHQLSNNPSLQELIKEEIIRRNALAHIKETFRTDQLDEISGWVSDNDVVALISARANSLANTNFLTHSPQWANAKIFIHPKLYAESLAKSEELIARRANKQNALPQILTINQTPSKIAPEYFKRMNVTDQKEYIERTTNPITLAQLLNVESTTRPLIIERLINLSTNGQILLLQTYVHSNDPRLLTAIETNQNLQNKLINLDTQAITNPANKRTVENALSKIYARTQQEWVKSLLGKSLTSIEIPTSNSALIKLEATKRALAAIKWDIDDSWKFLNGSGHATPAESQLLATLDQLINNEPDINLLNRKIEHRLNENNSDTKSIRTKLLHFQERFIERLNNNDQSIPKVNHSILNTIYLGLASVATFFGFNKLRGNNKKLTTTESITVLADRLINSQQIGRSLGGQLVSAGSKNLNIPFPISIAAESQQAFQSWWNLAENLDTDETTTYTTLKNSVATIILNAEDIIRRLPYQAETMGDDGDDMHLNKYGKAVRYFIVLGLFTKNIVNLKLSSLTLTDEQRLIMLRDNQALDNMIAYMEEFNDVLQLRGNIETATGRKLNNNTWQERWGGYPLIRKITGFETLLTKSRSEFTRKLSIMLERGNKIIPGLYDSNYQTIITSSVTYIDESIKAGGVLHSPSTSESRVENRRSFYWDSLKYFVGFGKIIAIGALILLGLKIPKHGVTFYSLATLVWSISFYWKPTIKNLNLPWTKEIQQIISQLNQQFASTTNINDNDRKIVESTDQIRIIAKHEQEAAIKHELRGSKTVDLIVIISQNGSSDYIKKLETITTKFKNNIIRINTPVIILNSSILGSSGNSYLYAIDEIKKKYPASWQNLSIHFIFHGNDAINQPLDVQEELLKTSIANAYQAFQNSPNKQKGGHSINFSRDLYYGPIPTFPENGITLLTSQTSRNTINGFGLVDADFNSSATSAFVKHIYEKPNIDKLENHPDPRGSITLHSLKQRFNLSDHDLTQLPTINGTFYIAPNAVELLSRITDTVNSNEEFKTLKIHCVSDLLIVLAIHKYFKGSAFTKEIEKYANKRAGWEEKENDPTKQQLNKTLYLRFYKKIAELDPQGIELYAAQGHIHSQAWEHLNSKDNAQTATGGIDFSGYDNQEIEQSSYSSNTQSTPLAAFQGFNFTITDFKPILNLTESLLSP